MLLLKPRTATEQLEHIELLRQIKFDSLFYILPPVEFSHLIINVSRSRNTTRGTPSSVMTKKPMSTARRSRRALENASKMRQAYIMTRSESLPTTLILQYEQQLAPNEPISNEDETRRRPDNTPLPKDDFNDGEVDALFAWTEQLEWNDDMFKTDRIPTA